MKDTEEGTRRRRRERQVTELRERMRSRRWYACDAQRGFQKDPDAEAEIREATP
jgi:hypothetical protein